MYIRRRRRYLTQLVSYITPFLSGWGKPPFFLLHTFSLFLKLVEHKENEKQILHAHSLKLTQTKLHFINIYLAWDNFSQLGDLCLYRKRLMFFFFFYNFLLLIYWTIFGSTLTLRTL